MAKEKIRISKAPEERKQEIMDTAMRIFAENGYERTTMRDIAAAVGVVPGLCYRYFDSKQDLFEEALRQYVADFCAPIILALKTYRGDLEGFMACAANIFIKGVGKEKYHAFFHKKENQSLHVLLNFYNCNHLLPFVIEFLDSLNDAGTTSITDTASVAAFTLYGQIPIMDDDAIAPEKKVEMIGNYISKLLR